MTRDQFIDFARAADLRIETLAGNDEIMEAGGYFIQTEQVFALSVLVQKHERELIASWVADMCQGLDANTIAEAIRNGGNDAMDNFKVSK